MTHATSTNSVSASKNGATSKSATLGPVRYRSSRQPLSPSPSHSIRGHSLVSITQGHVAGTSLPLGRKASVRFDEVEGEEDFESAHRDLQSLPTDFCDSCCKYFANPLTKVSLALIEMFPNFFVV